MRLILLFLFLFSPMYAWAARLEGKPAPDAVLARSEGPSASVIGSRQGKKAIVVFWATWCPHCYEELGTMNDHLAVIEDKGIEVILVDMGETKEDVKSYFGRRHMKLASFIDEDNTLQDPYHLVGVPTLVFINAKGIVQHVTHQFPSNYEKYFTGA